MGTFLSLSESESPRKARPLTHLSSSKPNYLINVVSTLISNYEKKRGYIHGEVAGIYALFGRGRNVNNDDAHQSDITAGSVSLIILTLQVLLTATS